jgi:S-adenosylmethionine:tRNA ribosyltransferase-isomerase
VTHAAGLSSTGDPALDARLPLPERFEVAQATVDAVTETHARNGRVVAVGTTVVRALESAALGGPLRAQSGDTGLRIGPGFRARVVDGLLTGMHEPDSSHFALLAAFAPRELLAAAHRHAEAVGYLGHEFGDVALVLH